MSSHRRKGSADDLIIPRVNTFNLDSEHNGLLRWDSDSGGPSVPHPSSLSFKSEKERDDEDPPLVHRRRRSNSISGLPTNSLSAIFKKKDKKQEKPSRWERIAGKQQLKGALKKRHPALSRVAKDISTTRSKSPSESQSRSRAYSGSGNDSDCSEVSESDARRPGLSSHMLESWTITRQSPVRGARQICIKKGGQRGTSSSRSDTLTIRRKHGAGEKKDSLSSHVAGVNKLKVAKRSVLKSKDQEEMAAVLRDLNPNCDAATLVLTAQEHGVHNASQLKRYTRNVSQCMGDAFVAQVLASTAPQKEEKGTESDSDDASDSMIDTPDSRFRVLVPRHSDSVETPPSGRTKSRKHHVHSKRDHENLEMRKEILQERLDKRRGVRRDRSDAGSDDDDNGDLFAAAKRSRTMHLQSKFPRNPLKDNPLLQFGKQALINLGDTEKGQLFSYYVYYGNAGKRKQKNGLLKSGLLQGTGGFSRGGKLQRCKVIRCFTSRLRQPQLKVLAGDIIEWLLQQCYRTQVEELNLRGEVPDSMFEVRDLSLQCISDQTATDQTKSVSVLYDPCPIEQKALHALTSVLKKVARDLPHILPSMDKARKHIKKKTKEYEKARKRREKVRKAQHKRYPRKEELIPLDVWKVRENFMELQYFFDVASKAARRTTVPLVLLHLDIKRVGYVDKFGFMQRWATLVSKLLTLQGVDNSACAIL